MTQNEFFKRKGHRLESNKVLVRQTKNGQFHTTIPRGIAKAAQLKHGSVLEFELQAYGGIKLTWTNQR